ncbi:MAG: FHA domain-containing protein [Eggerthellaceae bacterium]|nr:FHA domain-containing protein [Eggerthellaceae bacterium]
MVQKCPVCNNDIADDSRTCSFCGFKLLGTTQEFTPVKLGEVAEGEGSAHAKRAELRVVRGPQTGIDIQITAGELSMGRDPACDIFLNDMTVSRRHAIIETDEKGSVIRDTNSYNGVWVNDKMEEACLLKPGDIIQIGAFCLVFRER